MALSHRLRATEEMRAQWGSAPGTASRVDAQQKSENKYPAMRQQGLEGPKKWGATRVAPGIWRKRKAVASCYCYQR